MFVKICGITREQDARVAVESGASAIGFIFWPKAARYVDPDRAAAIVRTLPPFVTAVGVFVDETAAHVNEVARRAGLGAVQLHGTEPVSMIDEVERPVVKAVSQIDAATASTWPDRVRLLVDAHDPVQHGGTGKKADWHAAARLAATRPILLAGGLTPENVGDAVRAVRPFGLDVSSGVEDAPGLKNPEKIRALFDALRGLSRSGSGE